ncbi:MAG: hypothetical protein ABL925_11970 [Methylococcales bacterium]
MGKKACPPLLIIGGDEVLSAEDRLKIPFHVGGSLLVLLIVLFWLRKRKKN